MQLEHIDSGKTFDFGRISSDYGKYRDIYPDEFYAKILELGLCREGQRVLDLGTGTGVLPRNLCKYGAAFVCADISENQIFEARKLSEGLNIDYIVSPAEEIEFPDDYFDAVLACQCYTYFNQDILLPKLYKMMKNDAKFAILSLIWLPFESEIAAKSEELVLKYNPEWNGANFARPIIDFTCFDGTPFEIDAAFSLDMPLTFTRENWHGRIKACRGIGASSLTESQISTWEKEHLRFLKTQPESFQIPHSAIFYILKKRTKSIT